MANVKGITIEFRGDTTQLSKALNDVRKEARNFDKELGYIDNDLKFNPGNVDLLKQKMAVLDKAAKNSEDNVKGLKKALDKMKENGVDETSEDYRELQRQIIRAESKQKEYNKQLKNLTAETSTLGRFSKKMQSVGDSLSKAGEALSGISMAAGAFDAALAGLAYKSGVTADELNTLSKVSGIGTEDLQKYKMAADLTDVSVDAIVNSQKKLKKSMYDASEATETAVDEDGNLIQVTNKTAKAFEKLGVKVTDSNGELKSQDEVFSEVIDALGKMDNETERDAIAMQLLGKNAAELNPLIEAGGDAYQEVADIFANNDLQLVDQETIDKANAFNDKIDEIKMTGALALETLGMSLAGYLEPALDVVAGAIEKIFTWLTTLDPEVVTIIGIIAGVVAGLAPLLMIAGKIAFAISSISGLMATMGVSFGAIAGPIAIAIAAIAAIIAIGVLLYKNWDKIKAKATEIKEWVVNKWTELKTKVITTVTQIKDGVIQLWEGLKTGVKNIAIAVAQWSVEKFLALKSKVIEIFTGLKNTVKNIWTGIKTAITHPIETAFSLIKKIVEKIKGLFSGLKLNIPNIKLPHFGIDPPGWKIGDLLKGVIPKLAINWYKQGGIFQSPSIIGVGEAGAEAVLPIEKLKGMLNGAGGIVINVYATDGMDVMALAKEVERRLINAEKRRNMAWA